MPVTGSLAVLIGAQLGPLKTGLQKGVGMVQGFATMLQAQQGSMVNTPPVFAWYVLGLVLEWVKEQGGVVEIEKRNIAKARTLYFAPGGKLSFTPPTAAQAEFDSWVSDPAKPVPFVGYTALGVPQEYMVGDQRFAALRLGK